MRRQIGDCYPRCLINDGGDIHLSRAVTGEELSAQHHNDDMVLPFLICINTATIMMATTMVLTPNGTGTYNKEAGTAGKLPLSWFNDTSNSLHNRR